MDNIEIKIFNQFEIDKLCEYYGTLNNIDKLMFLLEFKKIVNETDDKTEIEFYSQILNKIKPN